MISREPTIERLATAQQLLLTPFGLDESHLSRALAEIKAQIEKGQQGILAIDAELPTLQDREHELQEKIAGVRAQQPDTSDLEAKKAAIQSEIDNISTAGQGLVNGIETELWAVQAEIKALNADLGALDTNKKADDRIQELTAIEKTMATQLEEIEG